MAVYRLTLTPDDNGTFLVECPVIPEVVSFGDDEAAALHWGAMAIEEALAGRIHDGADIPEPDGAVDDRSAARLPLLTGLKVELSRALRRAGITRAELMRRLDWHRNSVDRLFDLNHASRLDQIEAAIKALDLRIDARVVEVASS